MLDVAEISACHWQTKHIETWRHDFIIYFIQKQSLNHRNVIAESVVHTIAKVLIMDDIETYVLLLIYRVIYELHCLP